MSTHSKLSPSSSERWMNCTASVALIDSLPPELKGGGSSVHASRGSAIHAISEDWLLNKTPIESHIGKTVEGHVVTEEDVEMARGYTEFVGGIGGEVLIEYKTTIDEFLPNSGGTADFVAMKPGKLVIADLKTGTIPVEAVGNTQLLIYALGVFAQYDWKFEFKKIVMVIYQPSIGVAHWQITDKELLEFGDKLKAVGKDLAEGNTKFSPSEKGCRWCPAKSKCPEMLKIANEAAAVDFADLSADDLSEQLSKIPLLKQYIDAVEESAYKTLSAGKPVKGYKLVAGRKSRAWSDTEGLQQYLSEQDMLDKAMSKPELLSVAQLEKQLKGTGVEIEQFVVTKVGEPRVVAEDAPGVDLNEQALERAQRDFASS